MEEEEEEVVDTPCHCWVMVTPHAGPITHTPVFTWTVVSWEMWGLCESQPLVDAHTSWDPIEPVCAVHEQHPIQSWIVKDVLVADIALVAGSI
mmetsp:Transcript_34894/g.57066  ORF Transcript_34894/g.57066 Transcript_34894/m.57066 type:complete len:93 (+) Transcript_34894:636-914(+)